MSHLLTTRNPMSSARRQQIHGPIVGLLDEAKRAGINPLLDFAVVTLCLIGVFGGGYFAIISFGGN